MTTLEKIRAEIADLEEYLFDMNNTIGYAAVWNCLDIIDKYASEECDNDCEHCAYLECPKEPCEECDYSEIVDWEQDTKTGKAKPIYWCERHKEPCEDAVSRQAVLEILESHTLTNDYLAIEQLPSVQPKAKTGRWKRVSFDKYKFHADYVYECENCKEHAFQNWDYCPNCGADMRGAE